jgi:hypothetical protein
MLGYRDALNAGYLYLEVRCLGCDMHQTVALNIIRRPRTTPIHELERYMGCKDCSQVRGYPYKRSHLVALRPKKRSALDPPGTRTEVDRAEWFALPVARMKILEGQRSLLDRLEELVPR